METQETRGGVSRAVMMVMMTLLLVTVSVAAPLASAGPIPPASPTCRPLDYNVLGFLDGHNNVCV